MVNQMQELDDFEDVEYREYENKEPYAPPWHKSLRTPCLNVAISQVTRKPSVLHQ